jgi:hypothetical protein
MPPLATRVHCDTRYAGEIERTFVYLNPVCDFSHKSAQCEATGENP